MKMFVSLLQIIFVATKEQPVRMFPIVSENVEKIGYRDSDRTLVIKFRNSPTIYNFKGVPKTMFTYMKTTNTSVGHYFHEKIKNKFPFTKA